MMAPLIAQVPSFPYLLSIRFSGTDPGRFTSWTTPHRSSRSMTLRRCMRWPSWGGLRHSRTPGRSCTPTGRLWLHRLWTASRCSRWLGQCGTHSPLCFCFRCTLYIHIQYNALTQRGASQSCRSLSTTHLAMLIPLHPDSTRLPLRSGTTWAGAGKEPTSYSLRTVSTSTMCRRQRLPGLDHRAVIFPRGGPLQIHPRTLACRPCRRNWWDPRHPATAAMIHGSSLSGLLLASEAASWLWQL